MDTSGSVGTFLKLGKQCFPGHPCIYVTCDPSTTAWNLPAPGTVQPSRDIWAVPGPVHCPKLVAQSSVGHERSGSWHPKFPWMMAGWRISWQANCVSSLPPAATSPCQPGNRVCGFTGGVSQEAQGFPALPCLLGAVRARGDAWRKGDAAGWPHPPHPRPAGAPTQLGEDLLGRFPSHQLPADMRGHRSQHLSVLLKTNPSPQPAQSPACPSSASAGPKSCSGGWGHLLGHRGRDPGLPLRAQGSKPCCHPFSCSTSNPALSLGMSPPVEGVPPSPACEGLKPL